MCCVEVQFAVVQDCRRINKLDFRHCRFIFARRRTLSVHHRHQCRQYTVLSFLVGPTLEELQVCSVKFAERSALHRLIIRALLPVRSEVGHQFRDDTNRYGANVWNKLQKPIKKEVLFVWLVFSSRI